MSERLRFRCPGCGSELEAPAGTVSERCTYCGLAWLLGRPGRLLRRFYQPAIGAREACFLAERHLKSEGRQLPGQTDRVALYYSPYYRFRALSLTCLSAPGRPQDAPGTPSAVQGPVFELRARHLDVTVHGCNQDAFGLASLGVRPQTLPTYAYGAAELPHQALVVNTDISFAEGQSRALQMNAAQLAAFHHGKRSEFAGTIPEEQSLIYFPIYLIAGSTGRRSTHLFMDGLARRVYRIEEGVWHEPATGLPAGGLDGLHPEPHRCPHCGHNFEPSPRSLFYHCANCARGYLLEDAGYRQQAVTRVAQGAGPAYPFWRLGLSFEQPRRTATVGAFSRLLTADLPLAAPAKRDEPFRVYVPAFAGADAEWQVQTAVRITRIQPPVEAGSVDLSRAPAVSLSPKDSPEFAAFAWNWLRMSYWNLRKECYAFDRAAAGDPELVWVAILDARLERSAARGREGASPQRQRVER